MTSRPTVLRAIPSGPSERAFLLVKSVTYDRSNLVIQVWFPELDDATYEINFRSVIGWQVLDERDLPEFWHCNVQVEGLDQPCLVYQVLQGGWVEQRKALSQVMAGGFYSSLQEWAILGVDLCVSVISEEAPPIIRSFT